MAGYLDNYGAGDERRSRKVKLTIFSVIGFLVLSISLYFFFHNYPQEQQAKRFFQLLAAHDYQGAYHLWASSDADRRDYPMDSFMQDWGPQMKVDSAEVLDGESCGNSVIVDVDAGTAGDRKVWVDRHTLGLSSPPNERGCVQALVDGNGNLFYQSKHSRVYDWFRGIRYKLHGRTYK